MFVLEQPVPAGATVTHHAEARCASASTTSGASASRPRLLPAAAVKLDGKSDFAAVRSVLKTPATKRSAKQKAELEKFFRATVDNPVRAGGGRARGGEEGGGGFREGAADRDGHEGGRQAARAFILKRGEYDKPGDKVDAWRLPAVLPPMPTGAPQNRLGLAQWLVDPRESADRARVGEPRVGKVLRQRPRARPRRISARRPSGRAIRNCSTGSRRSSSGMKWDMKAMQKLIVMSADLPAVVASVTPELIERDPENRLLARGPRFRLGGEAVRDQALASADCSCRRSAARACGPTCPTACGTRRANTATCAATRPTTGDGLYRRTLYTIWKRTAAPPTMLLFDAPTREICTVKRSRTNTPLQALVAAQRSHVRRSRARARRSG